MTYDDGNDSNLQSKNFGNILENIKRSLTQTSTGENNFHSLLLVV